MGFFAGVVRKKYSLFCVAPDGSEIEIVSCNDAESARVGKVAGEKILALMADSFEEMEEGFSIKIKEGMESAEDIPLAEVRNR